MIALFLPEVCNTGEYQTPNPLITNVGAYLCGSDIQLIQKRFPGSEENQKQPSKEEKSDDSNRHVMYLTAAGVVLERLLVRSYPSK